MVQKRGDINVVGHHGSKMYSPLPRVSVRAHDTDSISLKQYGSNDTHEMHDKANHSKRIKRQYLINVLYNNDSYDNDDGDADKYNDTPDNHDDANNNNHETLDIQL